ncbi:hypothetical protein M9Y10_028228 [Tritrichomonas musculus]|uniref:Uncharacterized protein n=1 Tax=Tritrichomonas musculus TaxID=1915356 RepID=A0ABR2KIQ8_9EUKA
MQDSFLDNLTTIEQFDILKKFGDYYWSSKARVNEYWSIPNLSEKICLKLIEFKQKKSISFKQQMTYFATTDDFFLIKQHVDTSILPLMDMKRFLNSLIAKVDDIGEKGTVDFEKMHRICLYFRRILTQQPNFNDCCKLLESLIDNDDSPKKAKKIDEISLFDPTILSIFLYFGYTAFCEGMKLDKGPDGIPACTKKMVPVKPSIIGGKAIAKMDDL